VNIVNVPLSDLDFSAANHRKTGRTNVDDLTASIRAHGLLQNLTVVAEKGSNKHQVIAGGRRLRALRALNVQGHIPADWPVPCNVVTSDEAEEASLTENVSREAMHPADEFDAFSKLADEGISIGDIAARFGKSERYVQQRMRLAHVAPPILREYRDGNATLEQMMALAITDDQDRQLRVWRAARSKWQRNPDELRGALTENEPSLNSSIGRFVGADAYEKAGGVIRRDLFGTDDDSYFTDPDLAQRLALEKLERTAEKIRKEGWAWVEARVEFGYQAESQFGEAPSEWKGNKRIFSDEVKQYAGAVVSLGHNGQTEVTRGLIKPEDRKQATKALKGEIAGGRKTPAPRESGDLSFAARQRLQAECGKIIAGNLTATPDIAIALLTAQLADRAFYDAWDGDMRRWVHIGREPSGRMPGNLVNEIRQTAAGIEFERLEKSWRERLPQKRDDLRAWVLAQDAAIVRQLLAFLVAREIDVVDLEADAKDGIVELSASARVNLAEQWKPTAEWLATLPKQVVIALARDAGADETALAALAKQPKAKLAETAIGMFPAGWLPKPLRAAEPSPKKKRRQP
jgi:ParB family chromosome partitioning protein